MTSSNVHFPALSCLWGSYYFKCTNKTQHTNWMSFIKFGQNYWKTTKLCVPLFPGFTIDHSPFRWGDVAWVTSPILNQILNIIELNWIEQNKAKERIYGKIYLATFGLYVFSTCYTNDYWKPGKLWNYFTSNL
jgi:hypothetical protein